MGMNGEPLHVAGPRRAGRPRIAAAERANRHVALSTLEIEALEQFFEPNRRSPRAVIVWLLEAEIERQVK